MGVLFGLWPRFCCFWCLAVCFAVSSGETQVWLGDLRVVVFGLFWWLCVFRIDLPAPMDMICPCTNAYLAYAHVRTEPLARHRPHSRKKKKRPAERHRAPVQKKTFKPPSNIEDGAREFKTYVNSSSLDLQLQVWSLEAQSTIPFEEAPMGKRILGFHRNCKSEHYKPLLKHL